jgi:uncharacterized protein
VLEFETPAGNMYAWDDEIGLFIPFSPAMREIISSKSLSREEIIEELREDFNEEDAAFFYDWIQKWGKIRPNNNYCLSGPQEFSVSEIRRLVLRYGLMHLTLCVTEDCNFRCKYCAYSDYYKYTRNHSNRYMDFTTAKKALDYYFSLLKEGRKHNPLRKPSIGFYGGEPLLNFKLIEKCVGYIKEVYGNQGTVYNITTNGSLLQKEKAEWLMDNGFIISVSLDGPEEEHDRLRVYKNGKGTFKDIMENIGPIMEAGYKDIFCLPVFDWKSDLFKKEEFFNRDDIPSIQRAFPVDDEEGCSYYQQFKEEDQFAFMKQLERAREYYFADLDLQKHRKKSSLFDDLIGQAPIRDLFMSNSIYIQYPIMPFTAACVPGRKIFVDAIGNYHICERINSGFPIGTVDGGLNFERILEIICEYKGSLDKCQKCKVTRRCLCCYKSFATDNAFLCSSKVCRDTESNMKKSFVETFIYAEKYPEFVEGSDFKYKNIRKNYGDH